MAQPASPGYDAIPDFGLLYDSIPLYAARQDVAFYTALAAAADGPVLELGCGTGRVLLPLARATRHPVTGLDGSREMLARCAKKLEAEPAELRERVTLLQGDVRDFSLTERFALIVAPFRVLQHLTTGEEQLACLATLARHLRPGGEFAFDVFNPSFTALTADRSEEAEDTPSQLLEDGRRVSRSARVLRVRWLDQVSEIELIYYVAAADGKVSRYVHAFEMRWYLLAELKHLLARASFDIRSLAGDFEGLPLTDTSPELVVRCRRKPQSW